MKISSLLNEDQKPNQGTVNQLPIDRDLIYRAKNKYPGYSSEQAMILLIADEMTNQEQTDAAQNNLIKTQQNAIKSIGKELQDYEEQAQETDREVERLKQLSGTLTTGSADRQQKAKVSADELEKLQKDLEELKSKSGMDPKVYNELNSQLKTLQTNKSTDKEDVKKLQNMVKDIEGQASVNYNSVAKQLAQTKLRLADKEKRFKEYKSSFSDYKKSTSDKLTNIGKEMNQELEISRNLRAGIMQDAEDISKMKIELSQSLDFINQNIEKMTSANPAPNKKVADISWLMNNQKQQNMPSTANVQESITEGYDIRPAKQYRNPNYNEWITKHLPGLFAMFKGRFSTVLAEKEYSDKQIADTLEEYVPLLYNLGNDKTPLTSDQVRLWLDNVKMKLWEQPVQQEMFSESLDKTYARMLDDIISLAYIKKG
jgi:chromosome segregation ATPase